MTPQIITIASATAMALLPAIAAAAPPSVQALDAANRLTIIAGYTPPLSL